MPKPKPMRYYLRHPWPQRCRRALYGALAVILSIAHYGSNALTGGDQVAPLLFAAAAAACLIGMVRVRSEFVWALSGWAAFAAFTWRLGQIVVIRLGLTSQEPPDSAAMAFATYTLALLGIPAVWWLWLKPRTAR